MLEDLHVCSAIGGNDLEYFLKEYGAPASL